MKVTTVFLVSSYNRLALLHQACHCILDFISNHTDFGLLVLDAGSEDGSKEYLRKIAGDYPNTVAVLIEEDRPSFSEGVNRMFKRVLDFFPAATEGLLFETDNLIKNQQPVLDAVNLLRGNDLLGAVGFTVQNLQGLFLIPGSTFLKISATILGLQLSDKFGLERMQLNNWQKNSAIKWHYYDVLYTSPLLVKIDAWRKSGGMDAENFPFAESDVHWAWKLAQAGFRKAIIQCTGIIHDNQSTVSAWSAKRVYDVHKRRLRYMYLVKGRSAAALMRFPLAARHLIEAMVFFFSFKNKERVQERLRMVYLALKYYP